MEFSARIYSIYFKSQSNKNDKSFILEIFLFVGRKREREKIQSKKFVESNTLTIHSKALSSDSGEKAETI